MLNNYLVKATLKILLIAVFIISVQLFAVKLKAAIISPDKYYLNKDNTADQKLIIFSVPNQTKSVKYSIKTLGVKKIGIKNEREFYTVNTDSGAEPANWIKLNTSEVTVDPGQEVEIFWHLEIPSEYLCKTNIAGIAISELPDDSNAATNNISIGNEVISQVHINTEDSAKEDCEYYENLSLLNFSTTQSIPVYNYHNIEFSTLIENRSEYLAKNLKGFIDISGIGGKETIEFNQENLDIYPKTSREFITTWIDPDYPSGNLLKEIIYEIFHIRMGPYQVRLGITKNIEKPIIAYMTIWIIPWRILVLIFLIIIIIVKLNRRGLKNTK